MTIHARIEYVTSDEGVSIACTKFGSGPPLIVQFAAPGLSSFEMELAVPSFAETYEAFASIATVIRYDPRNTGLSTRSVADVSVDAHVRDLEAVRRQFQIETAALLYPSTWARIAVEYAAAHPERVSAFVSPHPRFYPGTSAHEKRLNELIRVARDLGPEVHAAIRAVLTVGLEAHENAAWLARYTLESADFKDMLRCESEIATYDASAAAAKVRVPTLLLHRRLPRYAFGPATAEMLREHRVNVARLSSAIPGAQSAMLDGSSIWYFGDAPFTARMVDFLKQVFAQQATVGVPPPAAAGGLRTVLFTDIVGHTEMMQRLGDAKGRDVLRAHERITRECLNRHGGNEVKTDGDSFMASFASVSGAVECAVALQRGFAEHSENEGEPIVVRMGLNVGEPIEEDGDFFGSAVILGARIKDHAAGGEILVPEAVRHMLAGKGFLFADRGEFPLKGFEDAVRLYEVRWRE